MMTKLVVTVREAKVGNKIHCKEDSTLGANFQCLKKNGFLYDGQKFQCHLSTYNYRSTYLYVNAHA